MKYRGFNAKRDGNDAQLARLAADTGMLIRKELPFDWLVAFQGRLALVDVKMPDTGRWTPKQLEEIAAFERVGIVIHRVETRDDVLSLRDRLR